MARRGALPSSGPCRAPRAGETPHAPLVDGRMQSDECARGAGARSWPGSRASAKAPALLTQRERFLKISDGIHGALTRGRHRPAVASPAKQTAATVHAAAGTRAYHHAGLGQNASGTGLATVRGALWPDAAADPKAPKHPIHWPPPTSPGSGVRGG
ncbi:hypothetical protein PVAP13_7KG269755 [Panicum virgatum]|uniref:Uncharacterized protein n=1 Tax=Panicum virgatum TaxID=38727 RepID=A0A8T0QNY2_PANVG|nr:hypothetical protein PVAP13_7KG269755 [Panicum virgatum]